MHATTVVRIEPRMVFRGIEEIELIRIIVDSGSDLLPEVACEHNIQVLPLLANVNGIEYRDGIDLERDGFYALLEETGAFPRLPKCHPMRLPRHSKKRAIQVMRLLPLLFPRR